MRLQYPWECEELENWDIVGMNHYFVNGQRYLFVAMVQDGRCIQAEGPDVGIVFRQLIQRASDLKTEDG